MSKQCYFADQDRPSEVLTVRTLQRVRITRDPQFHTMQCQLPEAFPKKEVKEIIKYMWITDKGEVKEVKVGS